MGVRGGGGRILGRAQGQKGVLSSGDTSNVFISLEEGRLELDMVGHGAGVLVRSGELVMENVTMTGGETVVKVVGKGKWQ